MSKLLTLASLILVPAIVFCQNGAVKDLKKKYDSKENFVFDLSGGLQNLFGCEPGDAADSPLERFVKNIRSVHILGVGKKADGYSSRDIRRLQTEIKKESFEELLSVNSNNGQIRLMAKNGKNEPSELIVVLNKDDEGFITIDLSK